MLENVVIKNYRPFKTFNLDQIARVNLIVGTNNSGKSSLLEAIYLLTSTDVVSSLIYILNERGEFIFEPSDPRLVGRQNYQFSHIFHGHTLAIDPEIEISSGKTKVPSLKIFVKKSLQPVLLIPDNEDEEEEQGDKLLFEHVRAGLEPNKQVLKMTEDGLFSERAYRPFSRRNIMTDKSARLVSTNYLGHDALALLWDNITLTPKEDKVVEALQILESRVERLSFTSRLTSNSGILLRLKGQNEPVPLGSMGDGMRRVLATVASLVSVGNGTLLVDEIDTGLYYGVLTDMWRLVLETAVKQDAQVFATTHSWDCVRAFQQALSRVADPNSGCLIRLEKDEDKIEPVSYSPRELDIAIKQGIEVR